jgi:hypothetical protein
MIPETAQRLREALKTLRQLGTDLNRGASIPNLAEQIWDQCDAIDILVRAEGVALEVHADRFEECGHWRCDETLKRHPELAEGVARSPERQTVRDALALCFGNTMNDRQVWQQVSNAFDEIWP